MNTLADQVGGLRDQLVKEHAQAPGLFREMANVETLLAETYRARVLYELLQNSDDAGSTTVDIDLTEPGRLVWSNDGRPFELPDYEALCRSASSTKKRGGDAIGYRGIGFKAVAAVANTVAVDSGGVRLTFDRSGAAGLLRTDVGETPLLRVPASIDPSPADCGATFSLELATDLHDQLDLSPAALLFLRNVTTVVLRRPAGIQTLRCERTASSVTLEDDGVVATFHRAADGDTVVLVPMDPHAETITGRNGRLACFLPLNDELGIPVIASGHLLTDPSRTHAVLGDPSTQSVMLAVARLLAGVMTEARSEASQRLWELLVDGEDLRTLAMSGTTTAAGVLLADMKTALATIKWPFAVTDVAVDPADLLSLFPDGAPAALYAEGATSQARALRTVFGMPTLRSDELVKLLRPESLSEGTRTRLASRLVENARVEGRTLTQQEQAVVGKAPRAQPELKPSAPVTKSADPTADVTQTFGGAIARWRAAEIAAMEHLNSRGWNLTDVSRQNVGYDLDGTAPDGNIVHIEVKKVDGKDSRFALTNNEMSVMIAASTRYLLALVIGDGPTAQLALLDPLKDQVPRERVCRRWEWEYTDWSRFADVIG